MRLSEKTIELNYCSQFARSSPHNVIWFGLTQRQEAQAGFDACTKVGGKLFLFQFKASSHSVKGARRFHAPHEQMENLRKRCSVPRSVFYALPLVGTTHELSSNPDVLNQTKLLDVAAIPALSPPTTSWGTPRKNKVHYIDVYSAVAVIHSDPVEVPIIDAGIFISQGLLDTRGLSFRQNFEEFFAFTRLLGRNSAGVVVF
jgi:hypothetical protein